MFYGNRHGFLVIFEVASGGIFGTVSGECGRVTRKVEAVLENTFSKIIIMVYKNLLENDQKLKEYFCYV